MTEEWTYRFTERARNELRTLDDQTARRIVEKLEDIVDSEFREPTEWLESLENLPHHKLRIGEYRAITLVIRDNKVLEIHAVGHRRNIYDRF
ncbi:MAG: type II toxin-antitoxin system RelE/ParE family toxin [Halobacteria archaeon]